MALFLSTVTNKIDAKGRVSVPARFRSVLSEAGYGSFVCFPSFTEAAIEAITLDKAEDYAARLEDQFADFDEESAAFATAILADSHELTFDGEGRIMLPEDLVEHAGLEGFATFVGLGRRFQIWHPDAYESFRRAAREVAREKRSRFRPGGDAH